MQKKNALYSITVGFLIAVVSFEIISLMYLNLFPQSAFWDQDFAKIVRHIVEMGDRRKILLPHWDYLTTGEFDCAAPVALIIYMLTGNISLGFGIANIVNIFLWGFVIFKLFSLAGLDIRYKLLAFAMVILPYDFGMLSYTNMMFFCGGQYVNKTLVPVLLITALVLSPKDWKKPGNILVYVLLLFLSFLTALSGGLYVLVCGIAPIVVCLIISFISGKNREYLGYRALVSIAVVILALFGRKLCNRVGVDPASNSLTIRSTNDYVSVLNDVVNNFLQLFKPFFTSGVEATSFNGIIVCLRWVIVFVVIMGLSFIPRAFGLYLCKDEEKRELSIRAMVEMMLVSVFAWNAVILFMTMSSPRYHLIGSISLMLVSVFAVEAFLEKGQDVVKALVAIALGTAIALVNYSSVYDMGMGYFEAGKRYYDLSIDQCNELISYLDENGIDTVFFVDNTELPEFLRAYDKSRVYETYLADNGSVINYDFYYTERDRSAYSDRNLLLVEGDSKEKLPEYITENYTKVQDFGRYEAFLSDTNPIDGMVLIEAGLTTIDMATTPGYKYVGKIDGSGWLHTGEEGKVLESDLLYFSEAGNVVVNYSVDEPTATKIILYDYDENYGRSENTSFEALPESTKAEFNVEHAGYYLITVEKADDKDVVIKDIIFN